MTELVKRHGPLVVVLVLGLALRLAAASWWQARQAPGHPFQFGDSYSYWELARTIARGEPYQFVSPDAKVFRTPGYPALLSILFVTAGNDPPVLAARAVSALCGTLAIAAVYWLAILLFDARTALVSAAMVAVYPGAIALSVFVLSEAPFCPLMICQLALWTLAARAVTPGRAALVGGTGGLVAAAATLMRPSWLLFTPLAALVGCLFPDRRRQSLVAVGMLAGLALGMLPWWIRNAQVTGHFVPTTLQVGASLYDGLNPQATGASQMDFVAEFEREARAAAPDTSTDCFEYVLDRKLRDAALDWAARNPAQVVSLAVTKFVRMWNFWPNEPSFRSLWLRAATTATYVPVAIAAVVGAWRFAGRGQSYRLLVLPAVYFTLLHIVFVSSIRYREPAMLPLAVLAAAAIRGSPAVGEAS